MFYSNNNQLLLEGEKVDSLVIPNSFIDNKNYRKCGGPVLINIGTESPDTAPKMFGNSKKKDTEKSVTPPANGSKQDPNSPKKEWVDDPDVVSQPSDKVVLKRVHTYNPLGLRELETFLSKQHGVNHTKRSVDYIVGTVLDLLKSTIGISKTDVSKFLIKENPTKQVVNTNSGITPIPVKESPRGQTPKTKVTKRDQGELSIQRKYGPNFKDDPNYKLEIIQYRKDRKALKKKNKVSL
jgi:hypothetical protein